MTRILIKRHVKIAKVSSINCLWKTKYHHPARRVQFQPEVLVNEDAYMVGSKCTLHSWRNVKRWNCITYLKHSLHDKVPVEPNVFARYIIKVNCDRTEWKEKDLLPRALSALCDPTFGLVFVNDWLETVNQKSHWKQVSDSFRSVDCISVFFCKLRLPQPS